jgi:hypothetical protein
LALWSSLALSSWSWFVTAEFAQLYPGVLFKHLELVGAQTQFALDLSHARPHHWDVAEAEEQ